MADETIQERVSQFAAQLTTHLAGQLRGMAQEAGKACSLPECDALTLGVRCEGCRRRCCAGHAYWNMAGLKPLAYCPYCVLSKNPDLFSNDDDGADANE